METTRDISHLLDTSDIECIAYTNKLGGMPGGILLIQFVELGDSGDGGHDVRGNLPVVGISHNKTGDR